MPAAKLFIDWDTRGILGPDQSTITKLTGKNKSIRNYELGILQDGEPVPLPATSTVEVGVKSFSDPPGTTLALATAARSGWGTGSRWYFTLDLTNPAIDPLFGTNTQLYAAAFEIYMELPDGQQIATSPITFTIEKNVIET